MVAVHNAYRLHHMGFNTDGSPLSAQRRRALLQVTGTAAQYALSFNASLANAAYRYAIKCIWGHDPTELNARNEGENL